MAVVAGTLAMTGVAAGEEPTAPAPPGSSGNTWVDIGPSPIPPGRDGFFEQPNASSGRVTALVVDPTDEAVVFIGTSLGGVWRTTDGGAHWHPIADDAEALGVEELTLVAGTLWIGTGADQSVGVGLYRIRDAVTAPEDGAVLEGPFDTRVAGTGTDAGNGIALAGTVVRAIAVDPQDPDRMYVGTADRHFHSQLPTGGPRAESGLYFTDDATSDSPTFSRVGGLPFGPVQQVGDVAYVPRGDGQLPHGLVVTMAGREDLPHFSGAFRDAGILHSMDAHTAESAEGAAAPVFAERAELPFSFTGFSADVGVSGATVYVASSAGRGTLFRSTDAGLTFLKGAPGEATATTFTSNASGWGVGDHTGGVAVDPSDPDNVTLGGAFSCLTWGCGAFRVLISSTDGGATFRTADGPYSPNGTAAVHADTVAIAYSPSNPDVVWAGTDGGVYRTENGRTTELDPSFTPAQAVSATRWVSRNTPGLGITQFYELATHPQDARYTVAGTQDNGALFDFARGGADWAYVGGGDVFGVQIDQNAPDTEEVTSYVGCRRFDSTADALARKPSVLTREGWCNSGNLWPAFSARGPGSPTVLYGAINNRSGNDPVTRSTDRGASFASLGVAASALAASAVTPGKVVAGTQAGTVSLLLPSGPAGDKTGPWPRMQRAIPGLGGVLAVAFDPHDDETVYVGLGAYRQHFDGPVSSQFWTVKNISGTPEHVPATGLPDLPVTSIKVNPGNPDDPMNPHAIFVGTTSGVFASHDGGATFAPFGVGLPRGCEAAEDETCGVRLWMRTAGSMEVVRPGQPESLLRIATHGRGMWEIPLGQAPAAPSATVVAPAADGAYVLGSQLPADYSCTDEVAGSGVASCDGPVPDGEPFDTSTVGRKSFVVEVVDRAGNASSTTHSYRVRYDFRGFQSPVDDPPAVNTVRAGSAVPIAFSLDGDRGLDVLDPEHQQSTPVLCGTATSLGSAEPIDVQRDGLAYDSDRYQLVWKTDRTWAGTCRAFRLALADGTVHEALFHFR